MSFYREQLNNWLKTLDIEAYRVLDIGGGASPIKGRTKSWVVADYLILDNEAEKDYHKDWERPDLTFDANYDIDEYAGVKHGAVVTALKGTCDIVFMLEVAEYLFDPLTTLKNIVSFLIKRGIAYISFPTWYPLHEPKEIDCLRYTKYGIERLLKEVGFSKWEITPRVATAGRESLNAFYHLEGMHPVKNSDIIYDIGYMVKAFKSIDKQ